MRTYFKAIAFILAMLMALSVFAACDSGSSTENKNDETINESPSGNDGTTNEGEGAQSESATETEAYVEAVPEVPANNYGSEFFLWIMQDTNKVAYHWVEESENDVLSEAIYDRQQKVLKHLGVDIIGETLVGHNTYAEPFKTAVKNKDGSVDTMLCHVYAGVAGFVSENYLANIVNVPGINVDADYWNAEFMEDLSIGGKYYLGRSDFNIPFTHLITFNKTMMDQYADAMEKSVYDMVRDYEWTIDEMIKLANLVYIDQTADGKTSDDVFGMAGRQWNEFPGFLHACDIKMIEADDSGTYKVSLMNAVNANKTTELVEKLYGLAKSDCAWFDYQTTSIDTVPMSSGRTLLHVGSTYGVESLLDYDISFGVLPYPMWDTAQKDVGYRHLQWGGYICVPSFMNNPQMIGETLDVLSFYSSDVEVAYYEKLLGKQVADAPDDSQMLAIVWDTVCTEFAQTYCETLGGTDLLYLMARVTYADTTLNVASTVKGLESSTNKALSKYIKKVEKSGNE